jgi:uncharacterized membrane protein
MASKDSTKESLANPPRVLIALISIAGLGIMAYLTYIHFAHTQSFCDISGTVSCDTVTASIYSEILGLPVAILGLGYFGLVVLLSVLQRKKEFYQIIFLITVFALVPSLYLTATEIFAIKSFCILCETSKALMFAILATSFVAMKKETRVVLRRAIPTIIVGLLAAFVTFIIQTKF